MSTLARAVGSGSQSDIVSVLSYGIVTGGTADQGPALQALLTLLPATAVVRFPRQANAYVVKSSVTPKAGQRLISDGAVIDSTGYNGAVFDLTSGIDDVEFNGLSFIGPNVQGTSRAIRTVAARTIVRGCRFQYFWGGGVILGGVEAEVSGCTFREVQNKVTPTEGDYGCVAIGSTGARNIVENNVFSGFQYSAISIFAAVGNIIRGNIITATGFPALSMGIYALDGASHNVIANNTISGLGNEGIVFVAASATMEHNLIEGNHLQDCVYAGISLEGPGAVYNTIRGNTYKVTGLGTGVTCDHGILIDGGDLNYVEGNTVVSDGTQLLAGVRMLNTPAENSIIGNTVTGASDTGMIVAGTRLVCQSNRVKDCPTGIRFSFATESVIAENMVSGATVDSIVSGSTVTGAVVRNNKIGRKVNVTCDQYGNRVGTADYEGTVTLVAGAATITSFAIAAANSVSATVELYRETAGGTPGALYVVSKNTGVSPGTANIASTSATDTSVVRWRVTR